MRYQRKSCKASVIPLTKCLLSAKDVGGGGVGWVAAWLAYLQGMMGL